VRLALAAAAALAALAWTTQASSRPACTAGVRTTGGVTDRTFCGPARATVHIGRATYVFSGGSCSTTGGAFAINIGTITLPPGKPKYRHFGSTVFTTHDGTYENQAASWQLPTGAHNSLFHVQLTLGGLKRGTFAGTTLADHVKSTGTFHC
jgi:hypothetical protein